MPCGRSPTPSLSRCSRYHTWPGVSKLDRPRGRICESCRKGSDRSAGVSPAAPCPREDVGFCSMHGYHGPRGCLPTAGPIGPGVPIRPGGDRRTAPYPADGAGVPIRFGSMAGRGGSAGECQMTIPPPCRPRCGPGRPHPYYATAPPRRASARWHRRGSYRNITTKDEAARRGCGGVRGRRPLSSVSARPRRRAGGRLPGATVADRDPYGRHTFAALSPHKYHRLVIPMPHSPSIMASSGITILA